MGTTDENGIYFYEDTDPVSPLHTLLNLGQQSVGNAIETLANSQNFVLDGLQGQMFGPVPPAGTKPKFKFIYRTIPATNGSGISTVPLPTGGFANGVFGAIPVLAQASGTPQSAYSLQVGAVALTAIDIRVAQMVNGNFQFAANVSPTVFIIVAGW